jgi:hypothetical protein
LQIERFEPRVVLSGTNWAGAFGSTQSEIAYDVEVGPDGSAYVVGSYRDGTTIDFDDQRAGGTITSTRKGTERFAKSDAFLVKYDQSGGFEWAIHAANLEHTSINNISLDSQGNAYIVGSFGSDMALKRDGVVQAAVSDTGSGSGGDLFIAKISSSGNVEWLQALGGEGGPWLDIVEVLEDPLSGQVELVVSEHSWGSSDLDPGPGNTLQDALHDHKYGFLAKYVFDDTADSLALVWLQTHHLGTEVGSLWIREVDVSENQVVGVGSSNSSTSYIGIFGTATGAVLAEYEASIGATRGGIDRPGENLFISGVFTGSVDLDGDGTVDLVGDTTTRGYIANFVYDATNPPREQLSVAWATKLTGTGHNGIADVKLSPGGLLYGTGRFDGSIIAGSTELQSRGSMDAHVITLDPQSGALLSALSLGGSGYDEPRMLQVNGNRTVYVAGSTSSTDAAFPNVAGTFASVGSDDGFIAVFTPVATSEGNDPPVLDPGGPYSGFRDAPITFDASGSFDFDNLDGTADVEAPAVGDPNALYVSNIQDAFESRQRGRATDGHDRFTRDLS